MAGRWTAEEDEIIVRHAGKGPGWKGWAEVLPGRTYASICTRRQKLGVQFGRKARAKRGSSGMTEEKAVPAPLLPDAPWTAAQEESLLRGALQMVESTGHNVNDCLYHLLTMVRNAREGS